MSRECLPDKFAPLNERVSVNERALSYLWQDNWYTLTLIYLQFSQPESINRPFNLDYNFFLWACSVIHVIRKSKPADNYQLYFRHRFVTMAIYLFAYYVILLFVSIIIVEKNRVMLQYHGNTFVNLSFLFLIINICVKHSAYETC